MIHTLLIDDEPMALKNLATLLGKYCPQICIQATAMSVADAFESLLQFRPELVFLDVELSDDNSFELLTKARSLDFEKIFVTAHETFALQAIKWDASDYVLKPIDKEELIMAVEKATKRVYAKRAQRIQHHGDQHSGRLALPSMEGLRFIDTDKILYCESDGRYTRFHMLDNDKKILVSRNIGEYEELLPRANFVRIHSHYIVNLQHVEQYIKGRGGRVILKNGTILEVSVRKKDDFLDSIEG